MTEEIDIIELLANSLCDIVKKYTKKHEIDNDALVTSLITFLLYEFIRIAHDEQDFEIYSKMASALFSSEETRNRYAPQINKKC